MELLMIQLAVIMTLGIYFLPAIVAMARGHHQIGAIIILNTFLGWTLLGWIIPLVWAMSRVVK